MKKLQLCILGSLFAASLQAQSTDYTKGLSIWFDTPNNLDGRASWYSPVTDKAWENNSLPIGNGSLGGNVMGSIAAERITLNEKTLWRGGPNTEKGAAYYWNVNKESAHLLPEIRQAFTDGNQKKAEELVQKKDTENAKEAFTYAESKEEEAARLQKEAEQKAEEEKKAAEEAAKQQEEQQTQAAQTGQAIVDYACQFIGNPYVWGGTSLTNGADCSGFVQSVFAHFGISLPRTTWDMENVGTAVSYDQAVAGDIILYDGHVGIYMGNGQIVNAINSAKGIGILPATYTNIVTVRRLV